MPDLSYTTKIYQKQGGDVLVVASGGEIDFEASAVAMVPLKKIETSTVSLDPPSIATVTRGSVTFTLTGARAGDLIHMQPPSTLNGNLIFVGAEVTANDTVTVYLYNPTAAAIDDVATTWRYIWLDLT